MITENLSDAQLAQAMKLAEELLEDHRDSKTDEIDATGLAEEIACIMDVYADDDCTIHEEIFEIAAGVE